MRKIGRYFVHAGNTFVKYNDNGKNIMNEYTYSSRISCKVQ